MASLEETIVRLHESKPPATDNFTYLTIIEKSLSPAILPTLEGILQDGPLTNDIGWDLVELLLAVPGSERCLEKIAKLGNPREVILKVLEVMEKSSPSQEEEPEEDDNAVQGRNASEGQAEDEQNPHKAFITLCGMLGVLHRRLQVRSPSRFLHNTLQTVYASYDATDAGSTAAVIDLIRSLSGKKRPTLPTRESSTLLKTPFQTVGAEAAEDPEAEGTEDSDEPERMTLLLRAFVSCVMEAYVNSNALEWAARLLEYEFSERVVMRKGTAMRAFQDVAELQIRDALVGQLVAVAGDVGLARLSESQVKQTLEAPIILNPLASDVQEMDQIKVSSTGFVCLVAYWIFASEVFEAHFDQPNLQTFPGLHSLLKNLLEAEGQDPQEVISANPGTMEALIVLGLWMEAHGKVTSDEITAKDHAPPNFMRHLHLLTLISVFHPNIRVRNAATTLAGHTLHANPDEDDRLAILEDLLENCMFSSLRACAVTWFREEIISARTSSSPGESSASNESGSFSSSASVERLQYVLFPDLTYLYESDHEALAELWTQDKPFQLQVANFGIFLFAGHQHKSLVPAGMAAGVEHRYVRPLVHLADTLKQLGEEGSGLERDAFLELDILKDALSRISLQ